MIGEISRNQFYPPQSVWAAAFLFTRSEFSIVRVREVPPLYRSTRNTAEKPIQDRRMRCLPVFLREKEGGKGIKKKMNQKNERKIRRNE